MKKRNLQDSSRAGQAQAVSLQAAEFTRRIRQAKRYAFPHAEAVRLAAQGVTPLELRAYRQLLLRRLQQ